MAKSKHNAAFELLDCMTCNTRIESVFSMLSHEQAVGLNQHKSCNFYRKGQVIFSNNGLPLGLFCINSGKIKQSIIGVDGKEQILRLLKPGDIMGYRALLANDRYHADAIALEDCNICIVEKSFFLDISVNNQDLSRALMRQLAQDLKMAEKSIVSLSQKNVRERMAEVLLYFAATYGFEDDGITLALSLLREEIASVVGTSTESAIRLLSEFRGDGLISLDNKRIAILDIARLSKTAHFEY